MVWICDEKTPDTVETYRQRVDVLLRAGECYELFGRQLRQRPLNQIEIRL